MALRPILLKGIAVAIKNITDIKYTTECIAQRTLLLLTATLFLSYIA
ncbi:MAG: hypothetical protein U0Z75_03745 [Deinococcaceae bacterium]